MKAGRRVLRRPGNEKRIEVAVPLTDLEIDDPDRFGIESLGKKRDPLPLLFPVAAGVLFLLLTGEWRQARTWKRLRPVSGILLILLIAAPWFVLATLRNPPYFNFSMDSGPGKYRGFFWFYFFNEHILRFLNLRWPRDYDTVPRHLFWGLHLLWFFPWSAYLPGLIGLQYRGQDRPSRMRLQCLCWIGFILVFFTFSTTQEYYSLPTYPAFALLLGCAIALLTYFAKIGIASAVNGEPISRAPSEAERVLKIGNDMVSDEVVTTKADDKTQIVFLDGSTLNVGPNSSITIDKFVYDPNTKTGELEIKASRGVFRYIGGAISKTTDIKVTTPSATIGIRGGIATFEVANGGATKATFLYGDKMTVTGQGQTQIATRNGSQIEAGSGRPPTAPAVAVGVEEGAVVGQRIPLRRILGP